MTVYKFGGTSVQDADALSKVLAIIEAHPSNDPLVVVSSALAGMTNELLSLAEDAVNDHQGVTDRVQAIRTNHISIAEELIAESEHRTSALAKINSLCDDLLAFLESVTNLNECTDQSMAAIVSHGELLSTTIICYAMRSRARASIWHDARSLVLTNDNFMSASVDMNATTDLCSAEVDVSQTSLHVTQGFIGSTNDGRTTTLGRGGSDASAAILGAALDAKEIVIWTDVSGVYSADPRVVSSAQPVPSLSFGEIRDLALYGAKVLHPDAILPAIKKSIPVRVKNTFKPEESGTTITANEAAHGDLHAVTSLKNCILLQGSTADVQMCIRSGNILHRVVLDSMALEHGACVVHAPTRDDETAVEVATTGTNVHQQNVGLVVITGPQASATSTLARVSDQLQEVPVRQIVAGLSRWASYIVVSDADLTRAVELVHDLIATN